MLPQRKTSQFQAQPADDFVRTLSDAELVDRCVQGFKKLRELVPYLREARRRWAQPGRQVPVPGRPCWTEWITQNLHVTPRRVQQFLSEPSEISSQGQKTPPRLTKGDWHALLRLRDLNNVRILRMAKAVTEQMFRDAESLDDDAAKALRSHALRSQAVARLSGMVSLAKIHVRNVDRGDFDRDPWHFNCLTGTIDLRAGICREHRREDFISKLAPVRFDPAADCPLWKKFLNEWMLGDSEKVG